MVDGPISGLLNENAAIKTPNTLQFAIATNIESGAPALSATYITFTHEQMDFMRRNGVMERMSMSQTERDAVVPILKQSDPDTFEGFAPVYNFARFESATDDAFNAMIGRAEAKFYEFFPKVDEGQDPIGELIKREGLVDHANNGRVGAYHKAIAQIDHLEQEVQIGDIADLYTFNAELDQLRKDLGQAVTLLGQVDEIMRDPNYTRDALPMPNEMEGMEEPADKFRHEPFGHLTPSTPEL